MFFHDCASVDCAGDANGGGKFFSKAPAAARLMLGVYVRIGRAARWARFSSLACWANWAHYDVAWWLAERS